MKIKYLAYLALIPFLSFSTAVFSEDDEEFSDDEESLEGFDFDDEFGDDDFGLTATSSSTGNFRFDIIGSCSAVTISGLSSVTINGAGTCRIRVKQDETPNYQAPPEAFFDLIFPLIIWLTGFGKRKKEGFSNLFLSLIHI